MSAEDTNDNKKERVYLIAIGGTGMTALAGMLRCRGYEVTGSDQNVYPPMSTFLEEQEIQVFDGYDEAHLTPAPDLVVIGNSISRGNPEVEYVLDHKIPYVSLPQALKENFIRGKYSCVVAGTHGKTTTSALLAWVLENAGRDPGFFIGGIPENFGRGFKVGDGDVFVSEGDEYDSAFFDKGSKFLHYLPDLVILNNLEFDHADIFDSYEDIETTFKRLINIIPGSGYLLANADDPNVLSLVDRAFSNVVTFGFAANADWRCSNLAVDEAGTHFDCHHLNKLIGRFTTALYGDHMLQNCLAVIATCRILGLTQREIGDGLASFKNVKRRLELKGEKNGIRIFDDFAHHPTEVRATLLGLQTRYPQARLWAIFEPRTATSKRNLLEKNLIESLAVADRVILAPLFMEHKIPEEERLSLANVQRKLAEQETPVWVLPPNDKMVVFLKENLKPNDVAIFMSTGDFNQVPSKLLTEL